MSDELSETEKAILDFEARLFRTTGIKERELRKELGLSLVQYHVALTKLVRDPRAVAYAPATIRRLLARIAP